MAGIGVIAALGASCISWMPIQSDGGGSPCPDIEVACGSGSSGSGSAGESGHCACGPGQWRRTERAPLLMPAQPVEEDGERSVNGTRWRYARRSSAFPGQVQVLASVDGASHFWAHGAMTGSSRAVFATGWRDEWAGALPACPREVSLEALGAGTMNVAVAAAPEVGCAASATSSASGSTSGPGTVPFTLSPVNLDAMVQYDSSMQEFEISGTVGSDVDLVRPNVRGTISSRDEWRTHGQGTGTGAATFMITPGRQYCAFTNRPVRLSVQGAVSVSVSAIVSENGMSSAFASADLTLGA